MSINLSDEWDCESVSKLVYGIGMGYRITNSISIGSRFTHFPESRFSIKNK